MVGVGVGQEPQSDGQVEQDSPPEHDPFGQVTGGGQEPQSDGQVEQDSPPEHDPFGQVGGGGGGGGVDVGAS